MLIELEIRRAQIYSCQMHRQLLIIENDILRQRIRSNIIEKRRYKDKQRQLEREIARLQQPSLFLPADTDDEPGTEGGDTRA